MKVNEERFSYGKYTSVPNPRPTNTSYYRYTHVSLYSLRFKIKVTFGHKLRYKTKVTFGEISLKLHQTNLNVAKNNVNVVVFKLPSQRTIYTCLTIDI
jgi:hypothetical protein